MPGLVYELVPDSRLIQTPTGAFQCRRGQLWFVGEPRTMHSIEVLWRKTHACACLWVRSMEVGWERSCDRRGGPFPLAGGLQALQSGDKGGDTTTAVLT